MAQDKKAALFAGINNPNQQSNVISYLDTDDLPNDQKAKELQTELNVPEGYVLKKEPKSKKIMIAIRPSLHQKVKAIADTEGESWNEMFHILLYEACKARLDKQ